MMSTVTPLVPAAARAGADLREARERLGVPLHDVALKLRIRLPHLEALEEGRISMLPGNAYALAFVRTYANALGLDAEEMVRRFKTEAAEFSRRTELAFPIPMPEHGLPGGAVLLLGVVLAIGAYTGWYRLSGEGRLPAEAVTAIPERLAPLAEQALPRASRLATGAMTEAAGIPKAIPADPVTAEMLANPAPPVMAISPSSAAAAQLPSRPMDFSGGAALLPMTAPGVPTADEGRMVLRVSADAWLLVKDRGGAILLNRVLKAGESWPVPPRPDLLLTTGNAGGTDIVVDGVNGPSLGSVGSVRRDLPLDLEAIKNGKLASAVVTPVAPTRAHQ
jgi:cytoskeleton protein RodZ